MAEGTLEICADDISSYLRGRMGLLVGPGITTAPGVLTELSSDLAQHFGIDDRGTYLDIADQCLAAGVADVALRGFIAEFFLKRTRAPEVTHLAKAKWSATLSATIDLHLEERFQQEAERRLPSNTLTVLDDARQPPPPRTTPVYKLLGRVDRENFAYSGMHYRTKRAGWWRVAVREFSDRVKGSPILCIGMSDCPWILDDLLAEMYAQASCAPYCLLLLGEDPLLENPVFRRQAATLTRVIAVRSTLGELLNAAVRADRKGYTPQLPIGDADASPYGELDLNDEVAILVNRHLAPTSTAAERERLLDLLFSPEIASWEPFVHNLDFRRTLERTLFDRIAHITSSQQSDYRFAACVVHGSAASGKTVLLKRLAMELAKAGELVVWLRRSSVGESPSRIRHFLDSVAHSRAYRGKRVVFFMDDPPHFTSLQARDLVAAARGAEVKVTLVAAFRTADWKTRDRSDLLHSFTLAVEESLLDELDDQEWQNFPSYLVTLGIAGDVEMAATMMRAVKSRHAQDTLSVLYWILPQTKGMITSSVRDEFFRLGSHGWLSDFVEGAKHQSTAMVKDAYEMVAVADHYRAPLPVEILVHALGVGYDSWLTASANEGPIWGLLYADDFEDGETTCYRTRNDIVTRILIEAINGGSFGHAGELRVLSKLLGACLGSQPVYREFCVSLLVGNEALERLEYQEGLQLFETAMKALPYMDRTLTHHKGLWIKNKGHDPIAAAKVLEEALTTSVYPYTRRGEIDEHIHTSLAATALDAIDAGTLPLAEGKLKALDHLEHARSPKIFNARAIHVNANLMLRLADKEPQDSADNSELMSRAVSEVDRALLILRNPLKEHRSESDIGYLEQAKDKILLKVGTLDDLTERAEKLWQSHASQQGFALVARKLYAVAAAQNRGKHFRKAFEYCQSAMHRVEAAGAVPSSALFESALHIYYHWVIQRGTFSTAGNTILWELVHAYSDALIHTSTGNQDPFYKYLHGLALAHLGQWGEAKAAFADLRRSGIASDYLWESRDFLLNADGGRRKIQGVMKMGARDLFFFAEDLKQDFPIERRGDWPRPDEIAHAFIRLSFGGATAVVAE